MLGNVEEEKITSYLLLKNGEGAAWVGKKTKAEKQHTCVKET